MSYPTDTQADELAAEAQRKADEFRRRQEVDDIKWLMAHPQGRRIVTRIFERTGIRRTPFNTNGSTMAFNAGQQNVGLWLESEVIESSAGDYMKLLKEFKRD